MHNDAILSVIIKSIQKQEPQANIDTIRSIFERCVGFECNDVCRGGLRGFLENLKHKSEITKEVLVRITVEGGFNKFCINDKPTSVAIAMGPRTEGHDQRNRSEIRDAKDADDPKANDKIQGKEYLGKRDGPTKIF